MSDLDIVGYDHNGEPMVLAQAASEILADLDQENQQLKQQVEQLERERDAWKSEYREEVRKHTALHNRVYGGEFGVMPEGLVYNVEFVVSYSVKVIEEQIRKGVE